MPDRPDMDDLKQARDGQTSAGKAPPTCLYCDEPMSRKELRSAVRMHVDGRKDSGERFGAMRYAHPDCMDDGGDDV